MNWLAIGTLALMYISIGMLLTRWVVKRGAMTVQNEKYYGAIALLWPVTIVGFIYLLFNAMVYTITKV